MHQFTDHFGSEAQIRLDETQIASDRTGIHPKAVNGLHTRSGILTQSNFVFQRFKIPYQAFSVWVEQIYL